MRHTIKKYIEMCACKDYLHERWSVEAVVKCSKKHDITLLFVDYQSFFDYLFTYCRLVTLYIFLGIVQKLIKQYVIIYLNNGTM